MQICRSRLKQRRLKEIATADAKMNGKTQESIHDHRLAHKGVKLSPFTLIPRYAYSTRPELYTSLNCLVYTESPVLKVNTLVSIYLPLSAVLDVSDDMHMCRSSLRPSKLFAEHEYCSPYANHQQRSRRPLLSQPITKFHWENYFWVN